MGDSSSLIEDSGLEAWALTATGHSEDYEAEYGDPEGTKGEEGWQPGDSPAKTSIEMKRTSGMGVV